MSECAYETKTERLSCCVVQIADARNVPRCVVVHDGVGAKFPFAPRDSVKTSNTMCSCGQSRWSILLLLLLLLLLLFAPILRLTLTTSPFYLLYTSWSGPPNVASPGCSGRLPLHSHAALDVNQCKYKL